MSPSSGDNPTHGFDACLRCGLSRALAITQSGINEFLARLFSPQRRQEREGRRHRSRPIDEPLPFETTGLPAQKLVSVISAPLIAAQPLPEGSKTGRPPQAVGDPTVCA